MRTPRDLASLLHIAAAACLVAGTIVFLLRGSLPDTFTFVEADAVFLAASLLYRLKPSESEATRSSRAFTIMEMLSLVSALTLLFLSAGSGSLPLVFFVFVALSYCSLFVECVLCAPRLANFLLKIAFAQAILVASFPSLFPNVLANDSSRDLVITTFIVSHAGGLPQYFQPLAWYNVSPMAPISYTAAHFAMGLPIMQSMLVYGFAFAFLPVLIVGAIILKLFESTRQSMVGMVLVALMPFFWADASWPIPEMLAVALVLTALLALLLVKPALLLIPVILAVVFTHGGLSIALIVFLAAFYVFKVRSAAKIALLEAIPIFVVAQVIFIAAAAELSSYGRSPSGLASELGLVESLLRPGNPISVHIVGSSIALIISESLSDSFWWVFLVIMAFFGLLELLRKNSVRARNFALVLAALSLFLFGTGALFALVGTFQSEVIRYATLLAFPMLCVPGSLGLMRLERAPKIGRYGLLALVALLSVAAVTNSYFSPGLWQDAGLVHYPQKLGSATTATQITSQAFLDKYDHSLLVVANYVPKYANITSSSPIFTKGPITIVLTRLALNGIANSTEVPVGDYAVLYSTWAQEVASSGFASPYSQLRSSEDIVYFDSESNIAVG